MKEQPPSPESTPPRVAEEPPPFGGTWTNVYLGVTALLVLYIVLFWRVSEVWR